MCSIMAGGRCHYAHDTASCQPACSPGALCSCTTEPATTLWAAPCLAWYVPQTYGRHTGCTQNGACVPNSMTQLRSHNQRRDAAMLCTAAATSEVTVSTASQWCQHGVQQEQRGPLRALPACLPPPLATRATTGSHSSLSLTLPTFPHITPSVCCTFVCLIPAPCLVPHTLLPP